jgi:hypothetical protein
MKNNLIINTPEKIEGDVEDFKMDCLDDEKNYTVAKIKLCRDIKNDKPLLFYSQDLTRNFRGETDPFGKKQILKVFSPSNHEAAVDVSLTKKFEDTVLAHRNSIRDYSPMTDISSQNMKLFMDEGTAEFVSDIGINVDGLSEDFSEMESVEATPFLDDISIDATKLKEELFFLKERMIVVKDQMADTFEEYSDPRKLSDDEFSLCLAQENIPNGLVQKYLELKEQIDGVKGQLGEVNTVVFRETATKIKLPERIKGYDLFK